MFEWVSRNQSLVHSTKTFKHILHDDNFGQYLNGTLQNDTEISERCAVKDIGNLLEISVPIVMPQTFMMHSAYR